MSIPKWMRHAVVLGLAFFLAVFFVKPIGVSTQFSVLSGIIHSTVDSSVIIEDDERESGYSSTNLYYDKDDGKMAKNIKNPLNYSFIFVLSIPVGAFLGYLIFEKKKKIKSGKQIISSSGSKPNFIKMYLPSLASGFLILFGARLAGGCTSGHMMSGIMQGSVSGLIFTVAVFALAVPTARLLGKKEAGEES